MEIYIHIPFCVRKCEYCDFLSGPADAKARKKYVEALIKEIKSQGRCISKEEVITSVFMGGGTPSILEGNQIKEIFHALYESFTLAEDAEITMEMNPGTVTEEKLSAIKDAGVNRLSIGLQSANDEELKMLGRIHTYDQFLETYENARKIGFDNINIDLISAIPGQTVESWKRTLIKTAELHPEHLSAYSLIIEEGTPFYEKYAEDATLDKNDLPLPDEDTERTIYEITEEILKEYGFHRYEISNYSTKGRECRHNIGYWERVDYLGIGLGSSSLVDHCRFHNTEDFKFYIENSEDPEKIREDFQKLPKGEEIEEFMFLGLRMMRGISYSAFEKCFSMTLDDVYGKQIEGMISEGLMKRNGDFLSLTHRGIDVSNQIFVEFMEPL